jgi:hypothetical protein
VANIAKRADGHWRARYRDAHGKEHARHFNRKIDAQNSPEERGTAKSGPCQMGLATRANLGRR